jgi:hypothetical protein
MASVYTNCETALDTNWAWFVRINLLTELCLRSKYLAVANRTGITLNQSAA